MDSYFNQLMEIQNSTDHSFFLLDQDSEPRFVIEADKRTIIIPAEFQFLGVKTDQRSEKIYFEVDRIFDDVDLSTKTCVIQYINAGTDDVDEGIYPVTELDTTTVPGKIVFKWEVDNVVCKYAGVVAFSVRFYEIDPETKLYTYCWNTIPENLPVLDGLNVSGSVTEDFPTELLEWNSRMAALNTEITNKISTADATMKADLKTAKGYMDGAQAARDGAEEAESRVQAIINQSESYTKQETINKFASALTSKSNQSMNLEIYPNEKSNVEVSIYGPMIEELRLTEYILDGSQEISTPSIKDGVIRFFIKSGTVNPVDGIGYCDCLERKDNDHTYTPHWYPSETNKYFVFYFPINYFGATDKQGVMDALKKNPVKILYKDKLITGDLYAITTVVGDGYKTIALRINEILGEGEFVSSLENTLCNSIINLNGTKNSLYEEGDFYVFDAINAIDSGQVYSNNLNGLSIVSGKIKIPKTSFPNNIENLEQANNWLKTKNQEVYFQGVSENENMCLSIERHINSGKIYAHRKVNLTANPDNNGKVTLFSENGCTMSVIYNKPISEKIKELEKNFLVAPINAEKTDFFENVSQNQYLDFAEDKAIANAGIASHGKLIDRTGCIVYSFAVEPNTEYVLYYGDTMIPISSNLEGYEYTSGSSVYDVAQENLSGVFNSDNTGTWKRSILKLPYTFTTLENSKMFCISILRSLNQYIQLNEDGAYPFILSKQHIPYEPNPKFKLITDLYENKSNILSNRRIFWFGDSIVAGLYCDSSMSKKMDGLYKTLSNNFAISNTTFYNGQIVSQIETSKKIGIDPDVIIFNGGANDTNQYRDIGNGKFGAYINYPGEISLTEPPSIDTDYGNSTVCGAFENFIRKLRVEYPNAKIIFIVTHYIGANHPWEDQFNMYNSFRECCKKWSVEICDIQSSGNINSFVDNSFTSNGTSPDHTHPTDEAHYKYFIPLIFNSLQKILE